MITKQQFWDIAGVTQHSEFEKYLKKIVLKPKERERFFKALLDVDCHCVQQDTFKQYFEEYAAERKSNMQDYTPDEVSNLLARLTNQNSQHVDDIKTLSKPINGSYNAADFTAGTGSLLIQKWWDDMTNEAPWTYVPHRYFYFAQEFADNVIPYLLLNLALRGMNCIVMHGDTLTGETKQIYLVENSKDDFLQFSDINVMPHNKTVADEFHVSKWIDKPINHIESPENIEFKMTGTPVYVDTPLKVDRSKKPNKYVPEDEQQLQLKDVADIERANPKKEYQKGTVVIQISATSGQCGRLTSSGNGVPGKYAVVKFKPYVPTYLIWQEMKQNIPRWLNKYKEDLNVKLKDVGKIPIYLPVNWMIPFSEQGKDEQLSLDV